jgi:hypothetical protein
MNKTVRYPRTVISAALIAFVATLGAGVVSTQSGLQQSPIDIVTDEVVERDLPGLNFVYPTSTTSRSAACSSTTKMAQSGPTCRPALPG